MFKNWWKILGIGLVIVSIIGGLMIPLGPRLSEIEILEKSDSLWLVQLKGVNTHFDASTDFYIKSNVSIKLKENELVFKAKKDIIESNIVRLSFPNLRNIQGIHNQSYVHIIATNKADGVLALFDALWVDSIQASNKIVVRDDYILKEHIKKGMVFPNRVILNETIRNLIFHVPMWFSMIFILCCGFISSLMYLLTNKIKYDLFAFNAAKTGLVFGVLGLTTGMLWAKYTWGASWTNDPKLNGAAIGMLVYLAYLILRSSIVDEIKKAKLSSVYNVFSFVVYIVFIFIMPRLNDSLHPGNGGNPGFKQYDLDSTMRMFFYPAVIGWIMVGFIILRMFERYELLKEKLREIE